MLMDMDPLEESGTEPPTEAPTRAPSPGIPAMTDFFSNFSLGDKKANGSPLKQVSSPGQMSPTKTGPDDKNEKKSNGEEEKKDERKDSKADVAKTPEKKVGNLMKELRNDVQQGAMEFNMDNFF